MYQPLLFWNKKGMHLLTVKLRSDCDLYSRSSLIRNSNICQSGNTYKPPNNMVHYSTVVDITQNKYGSQKCIQIREKSYHKWSFFCVIDTLFLRYKMVV